jgi:hypothetical protein
MKLLSAREYERYKAEVCIVNLIILTYLFRVAIPLLKFPFLLLYGGFIVYLLWTYRQTFASKLIEFIKNYFLILLIAFILILSFFLSNKLYLTVFKDVVNMVILLTIFFMSSLIVEGRRELKYFVSNLVYLIVLFAFFISILGLLDFFNIYSYIDYSKDAIDSGGNTISVDSNFALLPVFFGMVSIFYFFVKPISSLKKTYLNILLLIFSFDILLSGSRRGLITLIIILVVLVIAQIFSLNKLDKMDFLIGNLIKNSRFYVLSIFVMTILSLFVVFRTDSSFKTNLLKSIGSKEINSVKVNIALKFYKYSSITGNHRTFQEFYSIIWPTIPEDPDSGWGTRVHKTIFPLTGKNVEIVPTGVKGYLMDSTCNASYYSEVNLCESYTYLVSLGASKGDSYKASVYCFVSDSVDVNTVSFGVGSLCISKNIVSGKVKTLYNLESKGVWQKLEIEFVCNEGEVPILMSFWKRGIKDFSKLKGYIIFAYPKYEKLSKTESTSSLHFTKTLNNYKKLNFDFAQNEYSRKFNVSFGKHKEIYRVNKSFNTVFYQEQQNDLPESNYFVSDIQNYISSEFFNFPLLIGIASSAGQGDKDPIRNWVSRFISEDSTYFPYNANIIVDTISNSFSAPRSVRWQFACQIYLKEFNWKQKLLGGGFNFLNWYGYYFDKDKTRSDYPHNPFLSVLLYSGIIGLIFYLIFIYKVFYYYIKYLRQYKILAVFFIITSFFSFFSAGSPFDPPIMGFFVILPFFIHSIHKKAIS